MAALVASHAVVIEARPEHRHNMAIALRTIRQRTESSMSDISSRWMSISETFARICRIFDKRFKKTYSSTAFFGGLKSEVQHSRQPVNSVNGKENVPTTAT
ncbi:hypothetical protein [Burkholderia sp. IMCC1007]|uniref:hypothetical protein n=1 Tax=Burkholderia sp. IMCC1007 TaxID=3004104 RepID=UPI0022B44669|nr:hypothetical protein [Burkholderia sp. IMCC1007]